MRGRALLSWACVFSMTAAVSGGCDGRKETPVERAPRIVDSTSELFTLDDAGAAREPQVLRELVGDWTSPAAITTVRPQRPRAHGRPEAPPTAEVAVEESLPSPTSPPPPPAELRVPPPARVEAAPRWQAVPAPKGAHETAIQVSVAVGLASIGMGSAATMGDGAPGERAFAIGALGLGIASLSTAFVLYLTEPDPKQTSKPTTTVTLAPGALGIRGTF